MLQTEPSVRWWERAARSAGSYPRPRRARGDVTEARPPAADAAHSFVRSFVHSVFLL